MTVQEYYYCAGDLLVARDALKLTRDRMADLAEPAQEKTWLALEALWRELWQAFDDTHPGELNPFTADGVWNYP